MLDNEILWTEAFESGLIRIWDLMNETKVLKWTVRTFPLGLFTSLQIVVWFFYVT